VVRLTMFAYNTMRYTQSLIDYFVEVTVRDVAEMFACDRNAALSRCLQQRDEMNGRLYGNSVMTSMTAT